MRSRIVDFVVAGALGVVLAGGIGAAALAAPVASLPTSSSTNGGSTSVSVVIPGTAANGGGGNGGGGGGGGGSSTPIPSSSPTAPAGAGPIIPAHPVKTGIRLQLNHRVYRPGDQLIATGKGFTAGEQVRFGLYPGATVAGDFTANAKGKVVAKITLSTDSTKGVHTIEAFGWSSKRVAAAEFEVNGRAGIGGPNSSWIIWTIGAIALLGGGIGLCVVSFGSIAGLAGLSGAVKP